MTIDRHNESLMQATAEHLRTSEVLQVALREIERLKIEVEKLKKLIGPKPVETPAELRRRMIEALGDKA